MILSINFGCTPKPLQVAIIQCENQEPFMKERLKKICEINPEFEKYKDRIYFPYFDGRHDSHKFRLSNNNLESIISKIYEDIKPDLLIIDPYKSYSGVAENDNDQNREIIDRLTYILDSYGITGIVIHHEGKSSEHTGVGKSRGASTITDAIHNHWSVSRKENILEKVENFEIECCKSRNSQKFSRINLEIIDGYYFKFAGNSHNLKILIDILEKSNGEIETQGKFIEFIKERYGTSDQSARAILNEGVKNGYIVATKYGRNKIKYCFPLYKIAA